MTCHDRIELMQRFLDHDLSEAEERELHLHLQMCTECAELFERLQRLDSELAQLPKVTPAFSLVDAILPQLAELDRSSAALEETAAREPEAFAFVPPGGIPRTRRSFVSWKWVSGAAVAAVLLGVFVLKDQDLLLMPSLGKKDAASNASATASMSRQAADTAKTGASSPVGKGTSAASKQSEAAENQTMKDQNAPAAKDGEKPQPAASAGGSDAKQYAASHDQPATGPDSPKEMDSAAKDYGRSVSVSSPTSAGTNPTAPAANQPMGITAAPSESSSQDGSSGAGPKAMLPYQPEAMSSLVAPPPAEAASPDGKLVAVVERNQVYIRSAANGDTVYKSVYGWLESDVVSLVGWSKDQLLTYRVQHNAETADTVVIDVANKTETKNAAEAEMPKN
jgi:hypothetical protein